MSHTGLKRVGPPTHGLSTNTRGFSFNKLPYKCLDNISSPPAEPTVIIRHAHTQKNTTNTQNHTHGLLLGRLWSTAGVTPASTLWETVKPPCTQGSLSRGHQPWPAGHMTCVLCAERPAFLEKQCPCLSFPICTMRNLTETLSLFSSGRCWRSPSGTESRRQ